MKKRILALLSAILLLTGCLPVCAATQGITTVRQWSITLSDRIGASFYVEIPQSASQTAVHVTVAGQTQIYDASAADAQGLLCVTASVAASEMTAPITLQLVADGTKYAPVSYCVCDYAAYILQGSNTPYYLKSLVRHMLNYGAAAQNYFGVNTDRLANEGFVLSYSAQYPDTYPTPSATGAISGVAFYGASLVMQSQVAIRYYFVADSLDGIQFTANGVTCQPATSHGLYYVEVPGILPQNYDDTVVLSAQRGEELLQVQYSPLTYLARKSQTGSQELKALVDAMYGYHRSSLTYLQQSTGAVILPDISGGAVTADKTSYNLGDTVTLTVTPDAGYSQKLFINGQPILLDWQANTYAFTATEPVYTVTGSFEPSLNETAKDAARWDTSNQAHGLLRTYYPNNTDAWRIEFYGAYRAFSVQAKNYLAGEDGTGGEGYAINIGFRLSNDAEYIFRIIRENGVYYYQRFGIGGSDWYTKSLHANAVALICGDGAEFTLERTAADTLTLSVDGVVYDNYVMTGVTEDIQVNNVILLHYANQGQHVAIPYRLTLDPDSDQAAFRSSDLSQYRIVYDDSNPDYVTLANQLKTAIGENYGVTLPVVSDSASTQTDREILLGDTNRFQHQSPFMEYSVTVDTGVFRINTGGSYSAEKAVDYLCDHIFTGQALFLGSGQYYKTSLLTASHSVTSGSTARIMSANILADAFSGGSHAQAYYRAEILAGMLVSYAPDVVGLQEVDANWNSVLSTYLEKIEAVYGITYSQHCATYEGKQNFTSLLYRSDKFTVEGSAVEPFSWWVDPVFQHSYHMRNISWAQFASKTDSDVKFVVANTHWSYRTEHDGGSTYLSGSSTAIQTDQLRQQCRDETNTLMTRLKSTYSDMPVFLTGDFNTSLTYFTRSGWGPTGYNLLSQQASSNGTALSTVPSSGHYDHLFGTGSYRVQCFALIKDVNQHSLLTDHSFVYADLAF